MMTRDSRDLFLGATTTLLYEGLEDAVPAWSTAMVIIGGSSAWAFSPTATCSERRG